MIQSLMKMIGEMFFLVRSKNMKVNENKKIEMSAFEAKKIVKFMDDVFYRNDQPKKIDSRYNTLYNMFDSIGINP